jgi:hypothetical protein
MPAASRAASAQEAAGSRTDASMRRAARRPPAHAAGFPFTRTHPPVRGMFFCADRMDGAPHQASADEGGIGRPLRGIGREP